MKSKYKDRISNLPEPIRSKVISFLPMKDAIRTTILSKEWRYITSTLPNLEFDQRSFKNKKTFRNVVDRLLMSRQRVDVERFVLSVNGDDGLVPLHTNAWISFAVCNNVRVFHLEVLLDKRISKLPCCFFQQCSSLTDLYLCYVRLNVPPDAVFLKLKRCTLEFIILNNDNFTKRLFCICPLIEELTIRHCQVNIYQTFTISSSTLKILSFMSLRPFNLYTIKINVSSLQKIQYSQRKSPNMSSETLCSLLTASFASFCLSTYHDCDTNSILFGLCNVVRLSLCRVYIESLSRHPNSLELLSTCSSLRHLELEISPICCHVSVVLKLLNIYNKLVTLRVSFQTDPKFTDIPNNQHISSDKFMLEYLNTVELENFGGGKEELRIVRYVLENANVMEKMKVKYLDAQKSNATTRMRVSEELLNVTKASVCAKILFE